MSLEELNFLEHYFLENLNYNIYIDPEQYLLCSDFLLESINLNLEKKENSTRKKESQIQNKKVEKKHSNKHNKEKEYRSVSNISTAHSSFKSVSSKCDLSSKKQSSKISKV